MKYYFRFILSLVITLPSCAFAQHLVISEVMFNPDGDENARGCETVAPKMGFEIVLHEKYSTGSDPTSFLLKCKKKDVDIIYMLPNPPDAVNIIKRSKELGWAPKAWGFTRGTAVSYFGATLGEDSDYTFATFAWHPACKRPGLLELVERARPALGHEPFLGEEGEAEGERLYQLAVHHGVGLGHQRLDQALWLAAGRAQEDRSPRANLEHRFLRAHEL